MERLGISKKSQKEFLKLVKFKSNLKWNELAGICDVSSRTIRDWRKAKYTISYKSGKTLSAVFKIPLPNGFKILRPYWYIMKHARAGAEARQKIYGLLGNRETRRIGGLISQQRRRDNPEKYRLLGCNIRKSIKKPLKHSESLSELVGIILGDGGITNNQIRVTLNRKTDKEYSTFVKKLIYKVFGEQPSINPRENVLNLTVSGVNLVEAVEGIGLRRGNKIKNQVGIPNWIFRNKNFSKLCVRGLMDTDGGVYFHKHKIKGISYTNFGLTFTNHSRPLVNGVIKVLNSYGFMPSLVADKRIYIYDLKEIKRYFGVIGSSNPKHKNRLEVYLNKYKK